MKTPVVTDITFARVNEHVFMVITADGKDIPVDLTGDVALDMHAKLGVAIGNARAYRTKTATRRRKR